MVRLLPCLTYLVVVSLVLRVDIDLHTNLTVYLELMGILVLSDHVYPERVCFLEDQLRLWHFALEVVIIVIFAELHGAVGERNIVKKGSKVDLCFTNEVVRLEEVLIESLNSQNMSLLSWEFQIIDKPVVEGTATVLVPKMGVRLFVLLTIEETPYKDVGSPFSVHHLDVLCAEDRDTDLKLICWLRCHIPYFDSIESLGRDNVYPAPDQTLRHPRRGVVDIPFFNGLIFHLLPGGLEKPVF